MKLFVCCVLALALSSASASAVTLLSYDSAGDGATALTAATDAAGVTADNLVAGDGISARTPSSTFNFRDWDTDNASFADAIADDEIWTWGFTSTVAYDLTGLSLTLDRSGSGPTNLLIELSVNGGAFNDILTYDFNSAVSPNDADDPVEFADLDLSTFTQVTEADFQLSAFGSNSLAGTFDLEDSGSTNDLLLIGAVSAVPLPMPALLLLSGLFGLGALRYRRA